MGIFASGFDGFGRHAQAATPVTPGVADVARLFRAGVRRGRTSRALAEVILNHLDEVTVDAVRELAEVNHALREAGYESPGGAPANLADVLAGLERHRDWLAALEAELRSHGVTPTEIEAIKDAAH